MSLAILALLCCCDSQGNLGSSQSRPFVSASDFDYEDLDLFYRFLKSKGISSGIVSAGGFSGLYVFGKTPTGETPSHRQIELRKEFAKFYGIDFDKVDRSGEIIHPFEHHTLKFSPELNPSELRARLRGIGALQRAVWHKISKSRFLTVGEVSYFVRPWIDSKGRKVTAVQGLITGSVGAKKVSWGFLE